MKEKEEVLAEEKKRSNVSDVMPLCIRCWDFKHQNQVFLGLGLVFKIVK